MAFWAKAPPSGEPDRTEVRKFLEAGFAPLDCRSCANRVLVKKTSRAHTSVQWTADPATSCPEFAARVASGEQTARIDTCPKLRDSIELAVTDGLIEVPDG